jgi:Metallo-peptidase family M12B Reprolysin-like
VACYDGFGNMREGRLLWTSNFVPWHGGVDVLFYYPGDHNWWLGTVSSNQLVWNLAGNTAGFGNLADGRPIWIGDFTGTGGSDVLFYYPGDDNWWLGTFTGTTLSWQLVGNTIGFGHAIYDGRPFWIGDFTGTGGSDVLFYYPGDHNWWVGTISGGSLSWNLAGNTAGFGRLSDGRPFWIGDFNGDGRDEVLFYYPGDHNWWMGTFSGTTLSWQLVGNTSGFGRLNDGRPFWTGYFSSLTNEQILFYYPGDHNWWLGTITGGSLSWNLAGNTSGFGQVFDGRPIWIDDFNANALDDVLFYYPGDHNWWLGSVAGGNLQWTHVGNTAGFGTIWPKCAFWTGYFRGVFRADVLFYQPGDGNWWLGTVAGSNLGWTMVGNTGKPHDTRVRLHVKIVSTALPAGLINRSVATMQRLFSAAGILVELASTEDLTTNPAVTPFATVNVGGCVGGKHTPQQAALFGNRNGVGTHDVVAYFVTATTPTALNGCATFPQGFPGCVVTSIASDFTLAHEIGHVMGLNHTAGEVCSTTPPTALMTGCGTGTIVTANPTLSAAEIGNMVRSPIALRC